MLVDRSKTVKIQFVKDERNCYIKLCSSFGANFNVDPLTENTVPLYFEKSYPAPEPDPGRDDF